MVVGTPSLTHDQTEAPTHPSALKLLQHFSQVSPNEIPSDLPPKRTIQDNIDVCECGLVEGKKDRKNPKLE